jgi:type II secretory pathway component PulF
MYCTSCGKQMPGVPSRCPECRKFTPAFWLNIYSLGIWAIIIQTSANYFFKLIPQYVVAILSIGGDLPLPIRWQIMLSSFFQNWILVLFIAGALLSLALRRWGNRLPAFVRSGKVLAVVTCLVLAALINGILVGFRFTLGFLLWAVERLPLGP